MPKILIIEDNPDNREIYVTILKKAGYKVLEAVDGEEGLKKSRKEKPDLVILDLSLPKLSGWDLARIIKEDEALKNIPLLALTAHAMEGDREKALKICDAYIAKPCTPRELVQEVEKLLQEQTL